MQSLQSELSVSLDSYRYNNLAVFGDADGEALYFAMDVKPRPCFTWDLVRDILEFQRGFAALRHTAGVHPRCLVFASHTPGLFSLGGDLNLFRAVIGSQDREMLTRYAEDCVSILYNHMHAPETVTVTLLEGDALGAGLESALSSDVVIAERGVRAGFPEVLFNLVPGHGALHFLARRIGLAAAERMIRDGGVHTAEALHALGLIDVLVERGEGRQAVRALLARERKSWNAFQALQHIKRQVQPVTREALTASARIWVEAAMRLTDRNLRMMERLVHAQERRLGSTDTGAAAYVPEQHKAAA